MRALLKHNRQAPRKVRLIANLIRGKKATEALTILKHTPKKASDSVAKVLKSAIANARQDSSKKEDDFYIEKITVDKGFTMKRRMPKWRGTSDPIRKHTSNIVIELGEVEKNTPQTKEVEKEEAPKVEKNKKETKEKSAK